MDLIFIGSYVSKKESLKNKNFSQAGILFQEKVIRSLKPVLSISLIPIFYKGKNNFSDEFETVYVHDSSGIRLKKLLFDTLNTVKYIIKSKVENIVIYNLDKHNFLIVLILKILGKKIIIIAADYAVYNNSFVNRLFSWMYSKINGVLILNSKIQVNSNSKVQIGIYEKEHVIKNKRELNNNVIISGSLGETTGFELVLKTFSKNKDFNLYITGRPFRYSDDEFNSLIDKYVNNSTNIKYLGLVSYEEYLKTLEFCDIAMSLRNPNDSEHELNFPSKIIEYLANSKIVISSKKYQDVPNDILYYTDFNEESLSKVLININKLDNMSVNNYKDRAYNFIMENLTEDKLKLNIEELYTREYK